MNKTPLLTVHTVRELRAGVNAAKQQGKRIGLVPTMGNLHTGHMRLVQQAHQDCDFVVASIFVNPLQFNDAGDLSRYPRTLAHDQALLADHHCDLLFAPSVDEMYPQGQDSQSRVSVPEVSMGLCGGTRPGHFDGVATVVTKLFNMVQADKAFFGEKDYQQLAVIKKMVADLDTPIEIIGVPTERNTQGLALSSRNGYLSPAEIDQASELYRTLKAIAKAIQAGQEMSCVIEQQCRHLVNSGFSVDYLALRRSSDLKPAHVDDVELVVLVAAFLGNARLIDNLVFPLNPLDD